MLVIPSPTMVEHHDGLRHRANGTKIVVTESGKETDQRLDKHETYGYILLVLTWNLLLARYEFGGPWGVVAIMTGFPVLMYYFWICLWFYDGKLVHPSSLEDIQPFLLRMWGHIRDVCTFAFSCSQQLIREPSGR
jgi:delta24(24(1))-sterol reductase